MHNIYDCVKAFKKLLNIRYHIIIGRKGKTAKLDVTFHKEDCFHLMGLQYLTDRTDLNQNRGLIFDKIDERNIFIFLSKNKDENYFCRSFFPETKYDYSLNQASWTLLHKEKDNLITKEKDIIYDRLEK